MRYLLTVLALVLSVNAHAQAPAANWCDIGEVWEGHCDYADPVLTQFAWDTGYYLAQLEEGYIHLEDVPAQYRAVIAQTENEPALTLTIALPAVSEWYEGDYTCYYNWDSYGIKTCYLTCVVGYQWPDVCYPPEG